MLIRLAVLWLMADITQGNTKGGFHNKSDARRGAWKLRCQVNLPQMGIM